MSIIVIGVNWTSDSMSSSTLVRDNLQIEFLSLFSGSKNKSNKKKFKKINLGKIGPGGFACATLGGVLLPSFGLSSFGAGAMRACVRHA